MVLFGINLFNIAFAQQLPFGNQPFNIKIGDVCDINMGFIINDGEISGSIEEQISKMKINIDGKAKNNTPNFSVETYKKGKKLGNYNGEINNNKLSGNWNGVPAAFTLPFSLPALIPSTPLPQNVDGKYIMESKNMDGNLTIKKLDPSSLEFNLNVKNAKSQAENISGIAQLENNKAKYSNNNCELLMQFDKDNVQVIQNQSKGTCNASNNITYDGFYEKKF